MEQTLPSTIRILVADDYKDWRRQVRLLFQARPEWQVIAEVADGPEAIQKAEELKPDLIVLDIGLPKLNGIEAARQIRQLSPSSKIVFLSQNHDLDVVRAALSTAQGYVYKTDFGRDFFTCYPSCSARSTICQPRLKRLPVHRHCRSESPSPPRASDVF